MSNTPDLITLWKAVEVLCTCGDYSSLTHRKIHDRETTITALRLKDLIRSEDFRVNYLDPRIVIMDKEHLKNYEEAVLSAEEAVYYHIDLPYPPVSEMELHMATKFKIQGIKMYRGRTGLSLSVCRDQITQALDQRTSELRITR